jgi:uncharacterized protein with ATP-grasp and redox domains
MKTSLECIPCFYRQALDAAKMFHVSRLAQKRILDRVACAVPKFSLAATPPEIARTIYHIVSKETGRKDPYRLLKRRSTVQALKLYPKLNKYVSHSRDWLRAGIQVAGVGNLIDFGAQAAGYITQHVTNFMRGKITIDQPQSIAAADILNLRHKIAGAKNLLYLGDNAGETVFDRVFIEECKRRFPKLEIVYAVKAKPIINDALEKDAIEAGLHRSARIISTGCDTPGVITKYASAQFKKIFRTADLVIAKGQGNFESLGESRRPMYFIFLIKCLVVADQLNRKVGSVALVRSGEKIKKR